jgi:hypothetical protein
VSRVGGRGDPKTMRAHVLVGSALLGAAIGCGGNPSRPSPVALGEPFELRLGERAAVGGGVSLVFADVASDSRCPIGVTCVSGGEALADVIFLVRPEEPSTRALSVQPYVNGVPIIDGQPATVPWCAGSITRWECRLSTAEAKSTADARPFTVRLIDLKPSPRAGVPIVRGDYVGRFAIGSR